MSCEQREGWGRSGARVRASSAGNAPSRRPKCSSRSPLSGRRPGAAPGAKVRAAGRSNCVGAASSQTIDTHAHAHTMHAAHEKFVRRTVHAGCFASSKTASMRYFRRAKALPRRQTGDQWLRIRQLKDGHDIPATWSRFEPCDKQRTWRISTEQHPPGVGSCRSLSRATHQPWHPSELSKK